MFVLRSSLSYVLVIAVSEAVHMRSEQQTSNLSGDYFAAMLARVNQEREIYGLPLLCTNLKLQAAAQRHSDDQAANDFMDHIGTDGSTMSDRISEANFDWSAVAENVAAGQPDVEAVMTAWMKSPGHRENILGNYTMFGTAHAFNAESTFQHYWTQTFGTGIAEECAGKLPQKLTRPINSSKAVKTTPVTSTKSRIEPNANQDSIPRETQAVPTSIPTQMLKEMIAPSLTAPGVKRSQYESHKRQTAFVVANAPKIVGVDSLHKATPAPTVIKFMSLKGSDEPLVTLRGVANSANEWHNNDAANAIFEEDEDCEH
ncbi:hypothetical protein CCR75_007911 [Bremia lactucae]|uniref:SCP domain-containing protein n=1 Tax=Bremia lactucae TaxID=4779 RepID=A0A976FRZ0_BRELC|nr:hypothetical protein CCR75_007911 [Bremia lactucae]